MRKAKSKTKAKRKTKRKAASGSRTARKAHRSYGSHLGGLNRKQLRFVEEYVKTNNATVSAQVAGYSIRTAYQTGSRLLKDGHVKTAIAQCRERIAQEEAVRGSITKERIIQSLAAVAYADPADLAEWNGDEVRLKNSTDVPPAARRTLQGLSGNKKTGAVSFKTVDRLRATELLAKMLGYLVEKHEVSSTEPIVVVHLPDNTPKPDEPTEPAPEPAPEEGDDPAVA